MGKNTKLEPNNKHKKTNTKNNNQYSHNNKRTKNKQKPPKIPTTAPKDNT